MNRQKEKKSICFSCANETSKKLECVICKQIFCYDCISKDVHLRRQSTNNFICKNCLVSNHNTNRKKNQVKYDEHNDSMGNPINSFVLDLDFVKGKITPPSELYNCDEGNENIAVEDDIINQNYDFDQEEDKDIEYNTPVTNKENSNIIKISKSVFKSLDKTLLPKIIKKPKTFLRKKRISQKSKLVSVGKTESLNPINFSSSIVNTVECHQCRKDVALVNVLNCLNKNCNKSYCLSCVGKYAKNEIFNECYVCKNICNCERCKSGISLNIEDENMKNKKIVEVDGFHIVENDEDDSQEFVEYNNDNEKEEEDEDDDEEYEDKIENEKDEDEYDFKRKKKNELIKKEKEDNKPNCSFLHIELPSFKKGNGEPIKVISNNSLYNFNQSNASFKTLNNIQQQPKIKTTIKQVKVLKNKDENAEDKEVNDNKEIKLLNQQKPKEENKSNSKLNPLTSSTRIDQIIQRVSGNIINQLGNKHKKDCFICKQNAPVTQFKFKCFSDFIIFLNHKYLNDKQINISTENIIQDEPINKNISSLNNYYNRYFLDSYTDNSPQYKSIKYICILCLDNKMNQKRGFFELYNLMLMHNFKNEFFPKQSTYTFNTYENKDFNEKLKENLYYFNIQEQAKEIKENKEKRENTTATKSTQQETFFQNPIPSNSNLLLNSLLNNGNNMQNANLSNTLLNSIKPEIMQSHTQQLSQRLLNIANSAAASCTSGLTQIPIQPNIQYQQNINNQQQLNQGLNSNNPLMSIIGSLIMRSLISNIPKQNQGQQQINSNLNNDFNSQNEESNFINQNILNNNLGMLYSSGLLSNSLNNNQKESLFQNQTQFNQINQPLQNNQVNQNNINIQNINSQFNQLNQLNQSSQINQPIQNSDTNQGSSSMILNQLTAIFKSQKMSHNQNKQNQVPNEEKNLKPNIISGKNENIQDEKLREEIKDKEKNKEKDNDKEKEKEIEKEIEKEKEKKKEKEKEKDKDKDKEKEKEKENEKQNEKLNQIITEKEKENLKEDEKIIESFNKDLKDNKYISSNHAEGNNNINSSSLKKIVTFLNKKYNTTVNNTPEINIITNNTNTLQNNENNKKENKELDKYKDSNFQNFIDKNPEILNTLHLLNNKLKNSSIKQFLCDNNISSQLGYDLNNVPSNDINNILSSSNNPNNSPLNQKINSNIKFKTVQSENQHAKNKSIFNNPKTEELYNAILLNNKSDGGFDEKKKEELLGYINSIKMNNSNTYLNLKSNQNNDKNKFEGDSSISNENIVNEEIKNLRSQENNLIDKYRNMLFNNNKITQPQHNPSMNVNIKQDNINKFIKEAKPSTEHSPPLFVANKEIRKSPNSLRLDRQNDNYDKKDIRNNIKFITSNKNPPLNIKNTDLLSEMKKIQEETKKIFQIKVNPTSQPQNMKKTEEGEEKNIGVVLEELKKQFFSVQYFSLLQKLFISYIFKNIQLFIDQISKYHSLTEIITNNLSELTRDQNKQIVDYVEYLKSISHIEINLSNAMNTNVENLKSNGIKTFKTLEDTLKMNLKGMIDNFGGEAKENNLNDSLSASIFNLNKLNSFYNNLNEKENNNQKESEQSNSNNKSLDEIKRKLNENLFEVNEIISYMKNQQFQFGENDRDDNENNQNNEDEFNSQESKSICQSHIAQDKEIENAKKEEENDDSSSIENEEDNYIAEHEDQSEDKNNEMEVDQNEDIELSIENLKQNPTKMEVDDDYNEDDNKIDHELNDSKKTNERQSKNISPDIHISSMSSDLEN